MSTFKKIIYYYTLLMFIAFLILAIYYCFVGQYLRAIIDLLVALFNILIFKILYDERVN